MVSMSATAPMIEKARGTPKGVSTLPAVFAAMERLTRAMGNVISSQRVIAFIWGFVSIGSLPARPSGARPRNG